MLAVNYQLHKLLSWAGVLGAQQLYLPAPHGETTRVYMPRRKGGV